MIRITKDLVGKWAVYYAAAGFAAFYGEIVSVNEEKKYAIVRDGIDNRARYISKYDWSLFETEEMAKKEYEEYLPNGEKRIGIKKNVYQ